MTEYLGKEIYELLEDALCDADWEYVVEAHEKLKDYLSRQEALSLLVADAQRNGLYD